MNFFGDKGLTKTSAQHTKDVAGHSIEQMQEEIANMSFINETANIIGNNISHVLSYGKKIEFLNTLPDMMKTIAKVKSLQAWLGEAIKEKNAIELWIIAYTFDDYCADNGVLNEVEFPNRPSRMSEDEYISKMNVKERNRYLYLQTLCAVYGKLIHPKGSYDVARKSIQKALNQPIITVGEGVNTILHHFTPSIDVKKIDEMYFSLQQTHREYQAEFNAMKHKMELDIEEQYSLEQKQYEALYERVTQTRNTYYNEFMKFKEAKGKWACDLKIIIPKDLQSIFDEINSLGK